MLGNAKIQIISAITNILGYIKVTICYFLHIWLIYLIMTILSVIISTLLIVPQ